MPTDPPAVSDGCNLLPYVPRDLVASVAVWRITASAEGARIAAVIPLRFAPDADDFTLAEVVGGGIFRVQARDHEGRFLKGYPAREVYIEGPPRELSAAEGDAAEAVEPPPVPPPPEAPRAVASQAVPVADPLPGMPTAMLDVPGLDPNVRAWLARYDASQSYVATALREATAAQLAAVQRCADAERDAARAHTQVAVSFVEKVTGPQVLQQTEALRALTGQLDALRAELATERAAHAQTRAQGEAARIEAATLRALLEAGGRYAPPSKGIAEILAPIIGRELGPTARVAIASALGLPADVVAQLSAGSDAAPHASPHAG